METKGIIHSTENFGTVDGPGIRFVIFTQGCRMRCKFCHNPDTWKLRTGKEKEYTAKELLDKAERYRPYWGENGGITVSGGEPLLQLPFLIELFKEAKKRGIHTCLDTCGQPFTKKDPFFSQFNELLEYTDLILLDLKHIDPKVHLELTKCENEPILEMATYLSEVNQPVWIRHVLLPEWSDKDEYLDRLHIFIDTLNNVERIEVLPYHTMGKFKWDQLGIPYELEDIQPPTPERIKNANLRLHTGKYTGEEIKKEPQ